MNKVKSEFGVIEKIIGTLKGVHAVSEDYEENTDIDMIIDTFDTFDKELEELGFKLI